MAGGEGDAPRGELHEFNPMLGFRGCRLGISFPEISAMQARAIFEAAIEVQKEGIKVKPEIMIPLVGFLRRNSNSRCRARPQGGGRRSAKAGKRCPANYLVGTMIEIPRACVVADEIAKEAEFFSFGTNDLTQTTLGMSRDDSGFPARLPGPGDHQAEPVCHVDTRTGVGSADEAGD